MKTVRRRPAPERFWAKVRIDPSGCWFWTGYRNRHGYGRFRAIPDQYMPFAHRWHWEQAHGPVTGNLKVLHTCDQPACVNLEHLWLGTQQENIIDRDTKGRNRGLDDLLAINRQFGPRAKLNASQVVAIRAQHTNGTMMKTLAGIYGVSRMAISRIVRGETYRSSNWERSFG